MRDKALGWRFHVETAITPAGVPADRGVPRPPLPPRFKDMEGPVFSLPAPAHRGLAVEEALARRRSIRAYGGRPLSLQALSQLLFAAQGATGRYRDRLLRTAPSAGALYPFEVYPVVHRVDGLPSGVYHYDVRHHRLTQVKAGDFRRALMAAGLEQELLAEANVVFVLTAVVDRVLFKYGQRGWRYIYMEAGHISQNLYLQATSLGLGSVAVGAFFDDEVNALIGVDGREETTIYLHAVGVLSDRV